MTSRTSILVFLVLKETSVVLRDHPVVSLFKIAKARIDINTSGVEQTVVALAAHMDNTIPGFPLTTPHACHYRSGSVSDWKRRPVAQCSLNAVDY
jgi:hypothetical protein